MGRRDPEDGSRGPTRDEGLQATESMGVDGLWIGGFFLILAGVLLALPDTLHVPIPPRATVAADAIRRDPPRAHMIEPLIMIGGYERKCMDCHTLFKSGVEAPPHMLQHEEIRLNHGMNDRCYNCHDIDDRNLLVGHGTRKIAYAESAKLCAKCHGPTYRDWEHGIHGRATGSWIAGDPRRDRLTCTQCHDPHRPAFEPISPLPGPATLRMGAPPDLHHASENPLRRWSQPPHEHETPDTPAGERGDGSHEH